jgi:Na+/H+-dicarboxylate symporter
MAAKFLKNPSLAAQILYAMILGLIFGFIFKGAYSTWGPVLAPFGTLFIRLLKMVIIPLVFFSIVAGISTMADLSRVKKVGLIFGSYWFIASMIAAGCGLVWALILRPGVGITIPGDVVAPQVKTDVIGNLLAWVPDNIGKMFVDPNYIQIIVFSLFVGIATALIGKTDAGKALARVFAGANEMTIKIVEIVMKYAPIGVFCLIADVAGTLGKEVLTGLGLMLLTQYVAYLSVFVIVYPIALKLIARVGVVQFYRNIYPAMLVAFSTCSSGATLPVTMKVNKERAGVPEDIVNMVAPPGATINMHAVCAEMAIYVIFAAQIYKLDLSVGQMIFTMFLAVVAAAGTAAVPGGGIIMSAIMLGTMGLPLTIVPWIAGIYRLIDMPNTMLNVTDDSVGMVMTASLMGELDRETYNAKIKKVDQVTAAS